MISEADKADTDQWVNSKCELGNAQFIAGFKLKQDSSIRTPNEFITCALLIVIACLGMPAAMAADYSPESGSPPLTYRIDDVRIRLTRHPGNAAFPVQRVSLSGSGSATLERDGKIMPFTYQVKKLLALMNEFYRIRFFEMPDDYTNRYSVFLKDGGTVETAALTYWMPGASGSALPWPAMKNASAMAMMGLPNWRISLDRFFRRPMYW